MGVRYHGDTGAGTFGLVRLEKGTLKSYIFLDRGLLEAFKIIYENQSTKEGTKDLINQLIEKGGSQFWSLEDIVS